jgi:hypothetical protein
VLTGISGPVVGGTGVDFNGLPYSTNPSYLSLSARPLCLPEGRYRVDLYANGRLAGHAEGASDWKNLRPVQIRDLRIAFCAPREVRAAPVGNGSANVFVGPRGRNGVVVFTVPKSLASGGSIKDLTDVVVRSFGAGSGLLPGLHRESSDTRIFANFDSPILQSWSYRGGSLRAGAGVSPDRRVYIGIAWGPGDGGDQTQIVNSFSQLG